MLHGHASKLPLYRLTSSQFARPADPDNSKHPGSRAKKVSLSLGGPGVELSEENVWRELSTHEKVEALLDYFKKEKLLDTTRQQEMRCPGAHPFVLETMLARKVILPAIHLAATPGIKHLAVWVSDPDPMLYSGKEWEWLDTFLYLTELWLDDAGYSTVYSGCSALQAVANAVQGNALRMGAAMEPLGRGNYDHPLEKLRSLGAMVGDQRRITALYIKRFVTDEQCYTWNGEQRRVNARC